MSSIRLFILGSLSERGEMHGHALRLLAEQEHIDNWTDFGPGAIYGAIKRLAADGLIEVLRSEREGNYPERQVYGITRSGADILAELRRDGVEQIVYRHDPVDLALARFDPDRLDELGATITARRDALSGMREHAQSELTRIRDYLTVLESHVMRHQIHRLTGEIAWHEELIAALPAIIEDEKSRRGQTHD
ncbi:MAG: PadR family transcriptional regulator [Salinibacterium sp.]|nr:PadR family transcriptional regulator [Salinibacterium sp.]